MTIKKFMITMCDDEQLRKSMGKHDENLRKTD